MLVRLIKGIEVFAVNIQHGSHLPCSQERYDDFAIGGGRTGDMSCKLMYVWHYDRLRPLPRRPADTTPERNTCTSHRSLKRTQHQFVALHAIKTRPPEAKGFMQHSRHVRHPGDDIRLAGNQRLNLRQKGFVSFLFGHTNCFYTFSGAKLQKIFDICKFAGFFSKKRWYRMKGIVSLCCKKRAN